MPCFETCPGGVGFGCEKEGVGSGKGSVTEVRTVTVEVVGLLMLGRVMAVVGHVLVDDQATYCAEGRYCQGQVQYQRVHNHLWV